MVFRSLGPGGFSNSLLTFIQLSFVCFNFFPIIINKSHISKLRHILQQKNCVGSVSNWLLCHNPVPTFNFIYRGYIFIVVCLFFAVMPASRSKALVLNCAQ